MDGFLWGKCPPTPPVPPPNGVLTFLFTRAWALIQLPPEVDAHIKYPDCSASGYMIDVK